MTEAISGGDVGTAGPARLPVVGNDGHRSLGVSIDVSALAYVERRRSRTEGTQ
ncbi:hypothetical protein [Streptomyces sp. NPDC051657]|uniref:hypothetical protein n=1 Tax=unclassified Streptomyces TaxID=2593676 RepID=UPI003444BA9E